MTGQNIITPTAFTQTQNGKRFYFFSGEISVTSSETNMISVDNIGERDVKLNFTIGAETFTGVDLVLRVRSNDIIILNQAFSNEWLNYKDTYDVNLIIPAHTSFKITIQGQSGLGPVLHTVAGYGKYLSLE